MNYQISMASVLEECMDTIRNIEAEEAWVRDQLHDVPFCEFTLKNLLKQHLKELENRKLKVMFNSITSLYYKNR